MTLKLFFDGGCRPNPGRMEAAVVARGQAFARDLGSGTSSRAEWLALLFAVEVADALGATDVVLVGDSADVIAQASGTSRCRREAVALRDRFVTVTAGFDRVRLRTVRRGQNLAGIHLQGARRIDRSFGHALRPHILVSPLGERSGWAVSDELAGERVPPQPIPEGRGWSKHRGLPASAPDAKPACDDQRCRCLRS